jgi:hypothetical protein
MGWISWELKELFSKTCKLALGPTQPPIHRVPGSFLGGVKWLVCNVIISTQSPDEVKNEWS